MWTKKADPIPTPDPTEERIAHYQTRQRELAQQLRDGLIALRSINDALHHNFREAAKEFPAAVRGLPAHPVAAGLIDLSWSDLRHDEYAVNGGRLGTWLKHIDTFLNPPAAPSEQPRKRQTHLALAVGQYDAISAARLQDGGRR